MSLIPSMSFKAMINHIKPSGTRDDLSPTYSRLDEDDISTSSHPVEKLTYSRKSKHTNWLWMGNIALFVVSTAILAFAYTRPISDATCTRQLFSYSPALEAVEYHEEDYKGVFHQPSIYRGTPTDEIDENWRQLWDYGGFNVPYDKLYLLNRSTEAPWQRTPAEFGGGAAAMLWGFHQIHCLDLVRQGVYRHVYEERGKLIPAFDGPEYLVMMHMDHCIELMRIHMQCHVDTTPYLVTLDDGVPTGLKADFSSHHKCRNYDKIRSWVIDNTAVE